MKLTKLATAIAALAIAGVNPAHADSFANAYLDITNFQWLNVTNPLAPVQLKAGTDLTVTSGNNSASASCNIDAASCVPITASSPVSGGGVIAFDSTKVNGVGTQTQPAGAAPNPGTGTTNPLPTGGTYAYGNYQLTGAIFEIPGITSGGANAQSLAQVGLISNASGHSQSNLGTNTSISFIATSNQTTQFSLNYLVNLLASVQAPNGSADTANASVAWNLRVTDTTPVVGGSIFTWLPTPLNQSAGVTAGDPDSLVHLDGTGAAILSPTLDLTAGHTYNITIGDLKNADATRALPEPSSLALMGIGVLGLMVPAFRRRNTPSA